MTFDDRTGASMPRAITITGTRTTQHRADGEYGEIFAEYLAPFAAPGVTFFLGGASGIDSLALSWLASQTRASLTVVVPGALSGQPVDARDAVLLTRRRNRLAALVELAHPEHPSTAAFHARNRWMVDHSEFVIGFPHGQARSNGTWYTLDYAGDQGKPRLILLV